MPAAPVSLPGPAAAENQKQVADSGGNSQPAAGKGSGGEQKNRCRRRKLPSHQLPSRQLPNRRRRTAMPSLAKLDGALFMIEVEKGAGASHSSWPFATCVAVGDKVLLTTGDEAAQLAEWRQQKTSTNLGDPAVRRRQGRGRRPPGRRRLRCASRPTTGFTSTWGC